MDVPLTVPQRPSTNHLTGKAGRQIASVEPNAERCQPSGVTPDGIGPQRQELFRGLFYRFREYSNY
jgi:hypothetical protein